MTHSRVWRDGKVLREDFPLAELDVWLADPSNLIWFDLVNPDERVLHDLARELNFGPHQVEDALAPGERPKVTRNDRALFLQAYATELVPVGGYRSRVQESRISAFLVANGLVTVRISEGDEMSRVMARWDDDPVLVSFGAGGLLHGLLDIIIDSQDEVISQLDDALETLEDLLFAETPQTRQVSRQAYRLRRELVEIRRLALPMRDVASTVIRHGRELGWHEDLHSYFEDLYDHTLREAEWTESLRDLVGSIFETNLSLNDMRLNVVMKKLSGWAAIIAVPTLVTGWFGMNVPYPGFGNPLGMWQALVIIVVSVLVLYVTFRRHDWL